MGSWRAKEPALTTVHMQCHAAGHSPWPASVQCTLWDPFWAGRGRDTVCFLVLYESNAMNMFLKEDRKIRTPPPQLRPMGQAGTLRSRALSPAMFAQRPLTTSCSGRKETAGCGPTLCKSFRG